MAFPPARAILLLAALSWLAACAASAPAPGPEAGAAVLPERVWQPKGEPRAVIVAVHGMNDHKGAFAMFGEFAAARGVRVVAYDQRGFGENPDRGSWPGADRLVADLREKVARERRRFPELPLFVLGESMGAAVAVLAFPDEAPPLPDGLVLSAPAVWGGAAFNPLYRFVLWVAARLFPEMEFTGESLGRRASDNIEMLRALARDPLFIKRTRVRVIEGVVALMDEASRRAEAIRPPTLVLVGRRDEIVPPRVQLAFAARIRAPCTLALYPDGWHMLLRDLQRRRVWEDILAWIDGRAPPSGLARPCAHAPPVRTALLRPGEAAPLSP